MSASFGRQELKFGAAAASPYTLTTSLVASDEVALKFVKKFSVYAYYTPGTGGTGNSINFTIEINPFDSVQDPTGIYWAPLGRYIDNAGQYAEEPSTFNTLTTTTAGTQYNAVPVDIVDPSAARVRLKVKETVVGGSAGSVKMFIGTNTIN